MSVNGKIKLYTKTVYGQVFQNGTINDAYDSDFILAKKKADKTDGCVGLVVIEKDVYLDGSMSEETKKIVLFGPATTVSKSEAIEINNRDNLGYVDINRSENEEYYHMPAKGVLFPKDKLTFVLDK